MSATPTADPQARLRELVAEWMQRDDAVVLGLPEIAWMRKPNESLAVATWLEQFAAAVLAVPAGEGWQHVTALDLLEHIQQGHAMRNSNGCIECSCGTLWKSPPVAPAGEE